VSDAALVKDSDALARMRDAGRIVFEILEELEKAVQPGVSTFELDRIAEDLIARKHARPAFKGYQGFPCVLCASVNEEVVHGIPSKARKLKAGDLMKLDFGVVYKGWFGDSARTVSVGPPSEEAEKLMRATRESLEKGIAASVPGNRVGHISQAVQTWAEAYGFSVVRDFVGHGIGRALHEAPQVPNYGGPNTGMQLLPGMTIAIEPMVNVGTHKVEVLDDDWTAVTLDRKLSAHFEHTIAITENGPEILTRA
jgi:methionyl aminopeptidase